MWLISRVFRFKVTSFWRSLFVGALLAGPLTISTAKAELTEENILGVWNRIRTSCGPKLSHEELITEIHTGNPGMPVRARATFSDAASGVGFRFEITTYPGVACENPEVRALPGTDNQRLICNSEHPVQTNFGEMKFRSRENSASQKFLYLVADANSNGANRWGRSGEDYPVEIRNGVLIISVITDPMCQAFGKCDDLCPNGEIWNSYWVAWAGS